MKRKIVLGLIAFLSLIATIVGIVAFFTGKNFPDFFRKPQSDEVVVAEQVRLCMQQHGLSQAHVVLKDASSLAQIPGDSTIFAECKWPPESYSEADGYSEVRVITVDGPGGSEAEGSTEVDRFFAPCEQLNLSYSFGNQGYFELLPSFVVKENSVVTPEGNPWQGEIRTLNFYFERGEIDVVRNLSYVLNKAECVP